MPTENRSSETTSRTNRGGGTIRARSSRSGFVAGKNPSPAKGRRRSRWDPFRPPDWRWLAAEEASHRAPDQRDELDFIGKVAAEWIAGQGPNGRRGRLPNRLKSIAEAVRLRNDQALYDRLRLLIIADAPRESIAETVGVSSEAIETVESVFFDVRDALDANDYLFLRVLNPLRDERGGDYHLRLRLALGGGPDAAAVLLDASLREEAARAFDQREQTLAMSSAESGAKRDDEETRAAYLALAREYRAESDRLRAENEATTSKPERELPACADGPSDPPNPAGGSIDRGAASHVDAELGASDEVFAEPSSPNSRLAKASSARPALRPLVAEDAASAPKRAIYDRLCSLAAPFRFREPWEWLIPGRGTHRGFDEPRKALDALLRVFGQEAAVAAGAAEKNADGTLRLAEAISDPDRPFLAIYDRRGGVLDLLTERGCLSGDGVPALVELEANVEGDIESRSQGSDAGDDEEGDECEEYDPAGDLQIAFGIDDVAVLRACGFRATTAVGLDRLSPSQIERLAELMSWPRVWGARGIQRGEPVRSRFLSITFAGWSPSTYGLEAPAELRRVAESFAKLEKLMDLTADTASVWRPEVDAIERLKYFARHRDANRVSRALHHSASREICGMSQLLDTSAPVAATPLGLEDAVRHYILPLATDSPELRERAGAAYVYSVSSQIVMPLISRAAEESDPAEKARALQEALLVQATLMQGARVASSGGNSLAFPDPEKRQKLDAATERFLKLCSQLEKIRRKDERCRKRTTIEGVARRALSKPVQGAGSSDLD